MTPVHTSWTFAWCSGVVAPRSRPAIAPEAPRLPDELEPASIDSAAVESGDEWRCVRIVDAELPDLAMPGLRFEEARLERVDLGASRLAHLSLSDVELDSCNLANADVRGGSAWRARIVRSRLTGVSWTEGLVRDAVLSDCRIDLSSFAATRLEQVVFERCLLMQADFQEANLRAVRFVDCDLTEADLAGARFDRCELRGCTIDGIRGAERLRGIAMPWEDIVASVATFASAVGVTVLDDDR
jgi:uncharacterized protein YjbI with pentapeptide repeats